jgi:hypothetical protein
MQPAWFIRPMGRLQILGWTAETRRPSAALTGRTRRASIQHRGAERWGKQCQDAATHECTGS